MEERPALYTREVRAPYSGAVNHAFHRAEEVPVVGVNLDYYGCALRFGVVHQHVDIELGEGVLFRLNGQSGDHGPCFLAGAESPQVFHYVLADLVQVSTHLGVWEHFLDVCNVFVD